MAFFWLMHRAYRPDFRFRHNPSTRKSGWFLNLLFASLRIMTYSLSAATVWLSSLSVELLAQGKPIARSGRKAVGLS